MITELGQRHIERMQERLAAFDEGRLSLHGLIIDLEALLGLLLDEADPEWVADLESECHHLEFINSAATQDSRSLSIEESAEVADAVEQLRLMLTRY